jgi:hypothetical protein
MKVDIWYGENKELETNGHAYVVLIMVIPPLDQDMRNAFAYLQNIEKICDSSILSDFKIFDVHSSCDGDDATISVIVPIVSTKLAKIIQILNMVEKRLEKEAFAEMKKRASENKMEDIQ